jgi:hypothetical protein
MVQIEFLPIVLTGIGIIVSILYYTSVLRNTNRNREIQIFTEIFKVISTEENQRTWAELLNAEFTDYDDYMKKYDSGINPGHYGKRGSIWWNYNAIGFLLKKGHISIDLVYDLMATQAVLIWNKWGDMILKVRENQEMPRYFTGFEHLVNETKKYRRENPELAP